MEVKKAFRGLNSGRENFSEIAKTNSGIPELRREISIFEI